MLWLLKFQSNCQSSLSWLVFRKIRQSFMFYNEYSPAVFLCIFVISFSNSVKQMIVFRQFLYKYKISIIDSFIPFNYSKSVVWKMSAILFTSTTNQIYPANVLLVAYKSESEWKVEQVFLVKCMKPEYVLLAKCSNCMFACACANCQTPDATVIFALQPPL